MPSRPIAAEPRRRDARDVILDAAEKVFSNCGFAGTSMKVVATEAGVAQSLLHYHFGNKDGLYLAVFQRRALELNGIREAGLDTMLDEDGQTVEDVLDLVLRPIVRLGRDAGGDFPRLLMRAVISDDEQSRTLISDAFDPFARRVVGVFRRILPGLTARDAVWGYIFSINVAMAVMAPTGRPSALSDGKCDDRDIDALLERIVFFAAAGLRAFAAGAKPAAKARARTAKVT